MNNIEDMGVDSENTVMVRVCKYELMGSRETWGIVRICVITSGNVREYVYKVKPGHCHIMQG